MNEVSTQKEIKEASISKTGYRALLLFRLLLESPRTRDEILEAFSTDNLVGKDISKDTITNTVNALRLSGCVISRPNMRTNFKYILKEHPFSIKITKSHVKYLQDLRKGIISSGDWRLIESVNKFYSKICDFVQDDESKNELLYTQPLKNINQKVLMDLIRYSNSKKSVNIVYDSPRHGISTIGFMPDFIQFENDKLYVWGYSFKYNKIGYLRIDRIKSVDIVDFSENKKLIEYYDSLVYTVKYKLDGYSAVMYSEQPREKLIHKSKFGLIIEAKVYSEFNFMQRILSYGADCTIISPCEFKEKFIKSIKDIRAGYDDEE